MKTYRVIVKFDGNESYVFSIESDMSKEALTAQISDVFNRSGIMGDVVLNKSRVLYLTVTEVPEQTSTDQE